jgi:hypothetical protein
VKRRSFFAAPLALPQNEFDEWWMGCPVGPHYAASSNVENAWRLKGKLLLIVPEMDTNVDPASIMQVVNALIRANRKFDLLFVPGANHGNEGTSGQRLTFDFFVHHLLGVEPPEWRPAPDSPLRTKRRGTGLARSETLFRPRRRDRRGQLK